MKIVAPVNSAQEAKKIIPLGADEVYCGFLPDNWKKVYTNIASPNKRECELASINSFKELNEIAGIAHSNNARVHLTLNNFYSSRQWPLIFDQLNLARKAGVDSVIAADLGLLLFLRDKKINLKIHISTVGTAFNSQTVKFYEELGARRVILPRCLQIQEIKEIAQNCPSMEFEAIVLNSGCKNIDGFCAFLHEVNKRNKTPLYDLFSRMRFAERLLGVIRRLPKSLVNKIKGDLLMSDTACALDYKPELVSNAPMNNKKKKSIIGFVSSSFGLFFNKGACGACRLAELKKMGLYSVKIAGREEPTEKKIRDVMFIKGILSYLEKEGNPCKERFCAFARKEFRKVYKMGCADLCYYPDRI